MARIELRTGREIEQDRLRFKADRIGHNGLGSPSRVTYLAHARGYVMARHPGCIPFAIPEKEWLSFPLWENSDSVASSIASKEWLQNRDNEIRGDMEAMARTYTPPVQFEAAYRDQIGRIRLERNQLGEYLTHEEIEDILEMR
jgi:hypothetical protein